MTHEAENLLEGAAMKKTLIYGTATAAVALALGTGFGLVSCTQDHMIETDYGALPIENPESSSTEDTPVETVYGPPPVEEPKPISTIEKPIEDVYGPPVDVNWNDETSDEVIDGPTSEKMVPTVYGPPTL